jgi:uncharacterized protein
MPPARSSIALGLLLPTCPCERVSSATGLRLQVSDLLAKPGSHRSEAGSVEVHVDLGDAVVAGDVGVEVDLASLTDGMVVRGRAAATARLICDRCLTSWSESLTVPIEQIYRLRPESDDELPIEPGGWIELGDAVHDEVSLGLPRRPVCRPDCRGLCPTCGTDLNVDPCAGHDDESSSPFSALKDLFEP